MFSGFMSLKSFFRDFWIFSCNSMGSSDSFRDTRFLFLAPFFICSMTLSYGVRALSYFFFVLPVTGFRALRQKSSARFQPNGLYESYIVRLQFWQSPPLLNSLTFSYVRMVTYDAFSGLVASEFH